MPTIPEIIAHRGASRECLENTLPAFSRALTLGADGIELDVHGTRDGVLVVHHDPVLITHSGTERAIASMTAHEVAAVRLRDDIGVPTLDAVCELVGERAVIYVEVKAVAVEALVIAALDRFPQVRMAVHSFDHRIPVRIREARPGTAIGLLSASYPVDLAAWLGPVAPDAVWQHEALIDEALVLATHSIGARLIAWTENDAPHARQLAAWGVDGLCGDVPNVIRQAVSSVPAAS